MVSRSKKEKEPAQVKLAREGWVSLSGFAEVVGISYPTALKLANQGKVVITPVGGVKRVYQEEVLRFMREGNFKGALNV